MALDVNHPPAGGFQNGGWYWDPSVGAARHFFNGSFGPPGVVNDPNAVGYGQPVSGASQWTTPGGMTPSDPLSLADQYIKQRLDQTMKDIQPILNSAQRSATFDKNNPFVFDEAQATASAKERFDPYYNAELSDFMSGVQRSRTSTIQDQEAIRKELTAQTASTTTSTQNTLDRALRASEQGYASAGLFGSGEQRASTGEQTVDTGNTLADYLRKQTLASDQSQLSQDRTLANLTAAGNTFSRQNTADSATAVLTDVEQQRQDALRKQELARQNYVGYPLAGGSASLKALYGIG